MFGCSQVGGFDRSAFGRCHQFIQQRQKLMDSPSLSALALVDSSIRALVPQASLGFRGSTIVHRAESVRPRE
jgi:hypothetical protein